MIYTAIDNFYLTDVQLQSSPSRKDGIEEATETTLRIYGCDLIQEGGILLRLPQAVMATGQVLFQRFYCKKSFAKFNVKKVAAGCVWLASKLEESATKARQVIIVFNRMECRRENFPIEYLDLNSKKYMDLRMELSKTERHILKEMGFVCHVEHPHKFISNYLATLETPQELRQEAWNLANDSLRTTLCVRFKSEVVACGVVYAAARRFHLPLPENPPWWKAFDAEKSGIDEVCRVLAHLYSLPKAQYISICKNGDFSFSVKSSESQSQSVQKVDPLIEATLDKLKDSKKSDGETKVTEAEEREEPTQRSKSEHRPEASGDRSRERDREKERDRIKPLDHDRSRESDRDREREETERDRDKTRDGGHRSKDRGKDSCQSKGHLEKSRRHSSRDRDYYSSSYSSREKDSRRHH